MFKANYSCFSKYKAPLMGVAAIMIVLFHTTSANNFERLGLLGKLFAKCNSGVDVFLLLSGIGCYYSLHVNNSTALDFYRKRVLNIAPTFLFAIIVYSIFQAILGYNLFFNSFFSCFRIGSDNPGWYIPCTMLLYFISPLLCVFTVKHGGFAHLIFISLFSICLACVLSVLFPTLYHNIEASLTRIPIFMFGWYCGKLSVRKERILYLWLSIPLVLFFIFMGKLFSNGLEMVLNRYCGSFIGIVVVLLFCEVMEHIPQKFGSIIVKILVFFGNISLELYLLHNLTKSLFEKMGSLTLQVYLLIVICSIIVSIPLSLIRKRICSKWA